MNSFQNTKMLGGIGSLLTLVGGFVPTIGPVLSIVGLILVFIAVKQIANAASKEDIFRNYLLYFLLSVLAIVAVFGILFISFGSIGGFEIIQEMMAGNTMSQDEASAFFLDRLGPILAGCGLAVIIGWILLLISAIFYKKSYTEIAEVTRVDLFKTTGLVYLIGAATLIIAIGAIILLVAKILEIGAFFSLSESLPISTDVAGIPPDQRRCMNCGRGIPEESKVCPYCGKNFNEEY